jgi:hypothetical protein
VFRTGRQEKYRTSAKMTVTKARNTAIQSSRLVEALIILVQGLLMTFKSFNVQNRIRAMVLAGLISFSLLLTACKPMKQNPQASTVGQWGYTTPIADNDHPKLFWNQSEIEQLRQMILVDKNPQFLVDIYNNSMKNAIAAPATDHRGGRPYFFAAVGYMIEPTQAKADAIRTTLLASMNQNPHGIEDWYSAGCFCGYAWALMFDLIQAYNPSTLSPDEKTSLKAWFKLSAERLKVDSNDPRQVTASGRDDPPPPTPHEGKLVASIPNWYTRFMGPSLAAALVSGDQAAVTYWADSGWPHNLFTFDGVTSTYPPDDQNRYDMVTSLLAVFPSGANIESYGREGLGYRGDPNTWYTTNYYKVPKDGGSYHFAQMQGPIMGAIMAYHNGMSRVFEITDVPGTEPAVLRTFKRAIQSRTDRDARPDTVTGHPSIGYEPFIWIAHRFYPLDPVIQGALPALKMNIQSGAVFWDIPNEFAVFLGFPSSAGISDTSSR